MGRCLSRFAVSARAEQENQRGTTLDYGRLGETVIFLPERDGSTHSIPRPVVAKRELFHTVLSRFVCFRAKLHCSLKLLMLGKEECFNGQKGTLRTSTEATSVNSSRW